MAPRRAPRYTPEEDYAICQAWKQFNTISGRKAVMTEMGVTDRSYDSCQRRFKYLEDNDTNVYRRVFPNGRPVRNFGRGPRSHSSFPTNIPPPPPPLPDFDDDDEVISDDDAIDSGDDEVVQSSLPPQYQNTTVIIPRGLTLSTLTARPTINVDGDGDDEVDWDSDIEIPTTPGRNMLPVPSGPPPAPITLRTIPRLHSGETAPVRNNAPLTIPTFDVAHNTLPLPPPPPPAPVNTGRDELRKRRLEQISKWDMTRVDDATQLYTSRLEALRKRRQQLLEEAEKKRREAEIAMADTNLPECVICGEDAVTDSMLTKCGHTFCTQCTIDLLTQPLPSYNQRCQKCPLCRTELGGVNAIRKMTDNATKGDIYKVHHNIVGPAQEKPPVFIVHPPTDETPFETVAV